MEKIKEMIHRYYTVQQASQEAAKLRKQLVPSLKEAGLTNTKFNFGDKNISYHSYNSHEEITQKMVRQFVQNKYPHIDAEQFVVDLWNTRKKKTVETIRVQTKK
jgi:5-methylcytosine-specific restriction endonuclease McrBC GTP-binding regulatory subunit McrB